MAKTIVDRIAEHEAAIAAHGFTLIYQDYCECADTPGWPGQIMGVTDWRRKVVRVSRAANSSPARLCNTLAHELHHVTDPTWVCGSKAPWL